MGIARSTYYGAPPANRDAKSLSLIEAICEEFEAYGYRRVTAELRHQGHLVNSKKVRRLMREHGLSPKQRRRYVVTTDSDHDEPIFPNLAADMAPDGPNQLWVADITYVAVATGFIYVGGSSRSRCAPDRPGETRSKVRPGASERRGASGGFRAPIGSADNGGQQKERHDKAEPTDQDRDLHQPTLSQGHQLRH